MYFPAGFRSTHTRIPARDDPLLTRKINDATKDRRRHQTGLMFVMNSSLAVGFLQGQAQYFQREGFDVSICCPPRREEEWEVPLPESIRMIEVPMEREMAPLKDFGSLWRLWRLIRSRRPVITNVGTPKAGLLGGLAAWLNRVPCRVYTLHGLRFETSKGLRRTVLLWCERLACNLAHRVICVSQSVRDKAFAAGLAPKERLLVLGSGSCNGVDASHYAPSPKTLRQAAEVRRELGIPLKAPVVLFVGRLTRDKGVPELMEAVSGLFPRFPELRLLLVGCFEGGDPLPPEVRKFLELNSQMVYAGSVQDTAPYYAAADVMVLPSHREGLPTVVLEAQAAGTPVIGASATGIVDVISDGKTGLLIPVGDVDALRESIAKIISDDALANKLRLAGLEQVHRKFQQEPIWESLGQMYSQILRPYGPRRASTKRHELINKETAQ